MPKIKNIIFDLGGVLVGLDGQRCIHAFEAIGAHEISAYVRDHRTEDLFFDAEVGNITQGEFCDEVRRIARCDAADRQIVDAWNALLTEIPDRKKQRLLELHDRYHLYLLSNTNVMHWNHCVDRLFRYGRWGIADYFDACFLSYEMHLCKPNEEIFRQTLQEAGIEAGETLFVDDLRANCEAAHALGIHVMNETTGTDWLTKIR